MTFRKINKVFFVGIGGIGMSGIAELLMNLGFQVSGSDMHENDNVLRLKNLGIKINIGVN
jgi:UDP-N-acetylmuramate--alanine ligase